MRWCGAVLVLAALSPGEDASFEALIERLGHDDALERDAATASLALRGAEAERALAVAAREHADPEVRRRALSILEGIRTGWPKVIEPTPGRRVELSDAPRNGLARLALSSKEPLDAWIEYELSLARGRACCIRASGTIPSGRGGDTALFGPLLPGDKVAVKARFLDAERKVRHVASLDHEVPGGSGRYPTLEDLVGALQGDVRAGPARK